MAIDIRATVTCSLGTLISASISDDYLQGSGLVKTKGSCEIAGVITPAIGTLVTFSYTKAGVTRSVPRKLRVLSSFADPFRRTTQVELGCKLTYLTDLKEPVDWTAFDDPVNSGYTEADAKIITIPLHASSVMNKCLTELGLTASSNPLTNKFSIEKFDFSSGYVQVLSDLLVSESYCAYLNENEQLVVFSLAEEGGTGPVVDSTQIIDLAAIGVGQLPGEAVTVSYSTLKLRHSSDDGTQLFSASGGQWDTTASSNTTEILIPYTLESTGESKSASYTVRRTVQETTEYTTVNDNRVPRLRTIVETTSAVAVLGSLVSAYLANGIPFGDFDVTSTTVINYRYDSDGNEILSNSYRSGSAALLMGSLGLPYVFSPTDYVQPATQTVPLEEVEAQSFINGNYRKTFTRRFAPWHETIAGQQALAEAGTTLTTSGQVSTYLSNGLNSLYLVDVTVQTVNSSEFGERAPNEAETINDNNGYRAESVAELELSLGSATAQRRIEFAMPYAPDDSFYKVGAAYFSKKSDAEAKANLYGRVQNKLLMGNRSGANYQMAPELLPAAPFAPFIVQANGLSALYRNNGTSWTMDASGVVVSTDALFWGAVGGTGTFWFPVAPGITTLPAAPAVVNGQMTVAGTVPVWSETVLAASALRLGLGIQSLAYALEVLTPVDPYGTTLGLTAARITAVRPPASAVTVAALTPQVSTGVRVLAPLSSVAVAAEAPVVRTGAGVNVPALDVSVAALAPDEAGGTATKVDIPIATISVTAEVPALVTGTALEIPAASITMAALIPDVLLVTSDPSFSSVVLLLHMDGTNGSTTFVDSSSKAHALTVGGNAQISTGQSKFGGASGYFDGSGDFLDTPTSSDFAFGLNAFTVEMWFYLDAHDATQNRNLLSWSTNHALTIDYISKKLRFVYNSTNYYEGTTVVPTGQWNHVAISRQGSANSYRMRLFLNGTQEFSQLLGIDITQTVIRLMGRSDNARWYKGWVDDVRLTKGVARYTANFTPPAMAFPDF